MAQQDEKFLSETNSSDNGLQAEQLAKLTGELAHEIKNPLSTIKVNLKLIAEQLDDVQADSNNQALQHQLARARRKIDVVRTEAGRLEGILDGFLRYIGRTELQLSLLNINEPVGDVVDFYYPQAQSRNITVRWSFSDTPLACKVDLAMLKQVMLNLFLNAQQAMPDGGELMIRTEKAGKHAQIRISDTGKGIPKDKLERIFEPFYSSRPDGSGLGLASAKRIVESLKGTINVASEIGKGTSFMIQLPLADTGRGKDYGK